MLHNSDLDSLHATLAHLGESVLRASELSLLSSTTITLVDNGSEPGYQQRLSAIFEASFGDTESCQPILKTRLETKLEISAENPGYGAGHNTAQLGNAADYVLVLNPDVELHVDALTEFCRLIESQPMVVAANPHSRRVTGVREFLCKRYPAVDVLILRALSPENLPAFLRQRLDRYEYRDLPADKSQSVELLSGACLFARGETFRRVGGFDPRYFLYFEDYDLSMRLREFGELRYLPDARIVHHGGNAARKGARHVRWFATSALRFFVAHGILGRTRLG
ncbi:MAG: glycosyltransferase family 2 protein [Pseudomonadota bacterium]